MLRYYYKYNQIPVIRSGISPVKDQSIFPYRFVGWNLSTVHTLSISRWISSNIPAVLLPLAFISTFTLTTVLSCSSPEKVDGTRLITDSAGRQLSIPDTVRSVIALKSGTLRLLSYMKVTGLVSHIEGSEQRRNVLYLFANPHLRDLPVIGAGNNYDTELLATAEPDIILATFMPPSEADRLQRLTNKPVLLLDYGDLEVRREKLYATLSLLGKVFYREDRADSLINYIESTIKECSRRAALATEKPGSVYVGGVAYNGAHGLNSTEPDYPPFTWLSLKNVTAGLELRDNNDAPGHEVLFIDPEQLIEWDPDVFFLDATGRQLWETELAEQSVYSLLKVVRTGKLFTVLPYNWNSTNYENLLCNTWYIGCLLMPSVFNDIDYEEKSREVYRMFYGIDIFDKADKYYRPFRQYEVEEN